MLIVLEVLVPEVVVVVLNTPDVFDVLDMMLELIVLDVPVTELVVAVLDTLDVFDTLDVLDTVLELIV